MAKLRGDILEEENILLHNIAINLVVEPETDMTFSDWYGDFLLDKEPPFVVGQNLRLVLSDGRSGNIFIQRIEPLDAMPKLRFVAFQGQDALS